MVLRGQIFDLLDIEHGAGFEEGNRGFRFLACCFILAVAGDGAGVDNGAATLAFADMGIEFEGLPKGHPDRGAVALGHRLAPQHKDIDPLIGDAVRPQGPGDTARRVLGAPRLHPRPDPLLQTRHNAVGETLIKIGIHWLSP